VDFYTGHRQLSTL